MSIRALCGFPDRPPFLPPQSTSSVVTDPRYRHRHRPSTPTPTSRSSCHVTLTYLPSLPFHPLPSLFAFLRFYPREPIWTDTFLASFFSYPPNLLLASNLSPFVSHGWSTLPTSILLSASRQTAKCRGNLQRVCRRTLVFSFLPGRTPCLTCWHTRAEGDPSGSSCKHLLPLALYLHHHRQGRQEPSGQLGNSHPFEREHHW